SVNRKRRPGTDVPVPGNSPASERPRRTGRRSHRILPFRHSRFNGSMPYRTSTVAVRKPWLHAILQRSPARFALLVFSALILLWTALLALPIASASGEITPLADSLFTAVSAICVTGLATVDMATHWSVFGQIVILL